MSKDNLPEEQTPRTEEAPAENQAEETTLPSPEEESAAAAENEAGGIGIGEVEHLEP